MSRNKEFQRIPVLGAALIASCGVYVPLIRGMVMGLFPGIAHRSERLAKWGVVLGMLVDAFYVIIWEFWARNALRMHWDPRWSYNHFLATWLPGQYTGLISHRGGQWPNEFQFVCNLTLWFTSMILVWIVLWKPRVSLFRDVRLLFTGGMLIAVASVVLWEISPMDHWWRYGASPRWDVDGPIWAMMFLGIYPICGYLIARQFPTAEDSILRQRDDVGGEVL